MDMHKCVPAEFTAKRWVIYDTACRLAARMGFSFDDAEWFYFPPLTSWETLPDCDVSPLKPRVNKARMKPVILEMRDGSKAELMQVECEGDVFLVRGKECFVPGKCAAPPATRGSE